jgi:dipeptidyl aminopeptidase/acylaminoacyl peptidase
MSRRPWLGGIGAAALAGGSFSAALLHFSRKWIAPPRVTLDPPRCEIAEEVRFHAADGTPLYGWFLRAGDASPALILCHGYQRSMEETFALGCQLRERGFHVLLLDFRGCGRSGGRYTTIGFAEPLDVRGALNWLHGRLGDEVRIGLLGISMGGSVALTAAAECPEVCAVVADSAFATLEGAVAHRMAGLHFPVLQLYRLSMRTAERLCGGRVAAVRPVDAARRLADRPVLLIHSTVDDVVPYDHARDLDAALAGPHELWTLDGVEHAMARFHAPEEYLRRVTAFFARHLGSPHSVAA